MNAALGRQTLEAVCRDLLGAPAVDAQRLTRAPRSAVYRTTLRAPGVPPSVIIKLHAGPARRKAVREHQVLTALAGTARLGVPRELAFGTVTGTDTTALVLQDLGPLSLRHSVRTGDRSRHQALHLLGQVLREFHRLPREAQPGTRATFTDQVTAVQARLPEPLHAATRGALSRAVDRVEIREKVLCHGDLHFSNVLLPSEDRRPYLIDFEQTGPAVPEYDVAQSVVTCDALGAGERALITSGYGGGLHEDLLTDLIVFHALRGWLYAAVLEKRDIQLWQARLNTACEKYSALT